MVILPKFFPIMYLDYWKILSNCNWLKKPFLLFLSSLPLSWPYIPCSTYKLCLLNKHLWAHKKPLLKSPNGVWRSHRTWSPSCERQSSHPLKSFRRSLSLAIQISAGLFWSVQMPSVQLRFTFKLNRGESGVNESRSDPKMCTASTTPIHFSVVVQLCIFLATCPDGQKAKRRQRCYE